MKWLLDLLGISAARSGDESGEAVEHVVENIEPRLRLVPGYRRKLQAALDKALTHIDRTVDRIHGPLELGRGAYMNIPEVNALFASPEDLDRILRDSNEITSLLHQPRETPLRDAWALLCVSKEEKSVFGMELAGNDVRRDVAQTAVNFHDHKIMSPAADEASVRAGIKQCIFDGLITYGLEHIVGLKSQRRELEDQRRILHARLRARQSGGNGLTGLIASARDASQPIESTAENLQDTEARLRRLPSSEKVLGAYLDEIIRIFGRPEAFIQMDEPCYRINRMGIKVDNGADAAAYTVCFTELEIARVLKRVVALVHFPLDHGLRC
jgi:hypothetical protein